MYLEKEDVSLYYEVHGEGDPLLLIHGLVVDGDLFRETTEILARRFRVITFDRRGNSRSRLKTEQPFDVQKQAEDVKDLLDHLGIQDTFIAGASGGAVIGQAFLCSYPERVRHLIMYEPAILGYLIDEQEVRTWVAEMQDLIDRRRYNTALLKFARHIRSFDDRSHRRPEEMAHREMGNQIYALTTEFPGFVSYKPDMEKLRQYVDKISVAVGEKSGDTVYAKGAEKMSMEIGRHNLYYPGFHNLPYDLPWEFAVSVTGTLAIQP